MNISKELLFSLDIGTRSVIGTVLKRNGKSLEVICEKYIEHEERAMIDGQIHDINLVSKVVKKVKNEIEEELHITLEEVAIAAAGRYLNTVEELGEEELISTEEITKEQIRSLELKAVKQAEDKVHNTIDGTLYCVGYSVKNYYLNSYVISNLEGHKGEGAGVEIIATFLPRSVIDSLYKVMNNVSLKVSSITLEPIAAIEAIVPKRLRLLNIALVDIGAGTSDIAISENESITAYGMVPKAGDEVTEAIAKKYLVDFNEGEKIKRAINESEEITYLDILGFVNTISSEEVKKLIKPIVKKIGLEVKDKIRELNGGKSPSAVFLVGGGAHTPGILDEISKGLNLPPQRIAIKDRKGVENCISNNELGSAGVTVLGIGLVALRNLGENFIDVNVNDKPVSLFNSHKHKVSDALLVAGLDTNKLIGKRGKSLRVTINGNKRLFFGEIGQNASIKVNGKEGTLETLISRNDDIRIIFAKDGEEAKIKVKEILNDFNVLTIKLDDKIINIEPIILVNGEEKDFNYVLNENDEVVEIFPRGIKGFKEYILKDNNIKLYRNYEELNDEELLFEGDIITTKAKETDEDKGDEEGIVVTFNGEKVILKGQEDYLIIDVFNHVSFDLSEIKNDFKLMINGNGASYTEKLKNGDCIELR
ncbi:MAG: cell division protein FtsA [Clostridium sp.]